MHIEFPILTSRATGESSFLDKIQEMVDSEFKELIVAAPFVDAYIMENVFKRCALSDKKLTIITRYSTLSKGRGAISIKAIDKAIELIKRFESINPILKENVKWYANEKLHAKFLIKDWESVLFGSQNFTRYGGLNGERGNYELGAFIHDYEIVNHLRQFVYEIIKHSQMTLYPTKGR